MGYQDEHRRGYQNGGYEYGNDAYNQGAREKRREQDFEASQRRQEKATQSSGSSSSSSIQFPTYSGPSYTDTSSAGSATDDTISSWAKGFAVVGALGYVCFGLFTLKHPDMGVLIVYAVTGAIGGAIAGAVLYVAFQVLRVVLQIGVAALVIGGVLHVLGIINLPRLLDRVMRLF